MIRRFFSLTVLLLLTVGAPAGAGQGKPRLDALFQALRATSDEAYAESVEEHIWDFWLEHPNGEIVQIMREGVLSLNADDYAAALDAFDKVIAMDATYAEAWNKRANVSYMLGDYRAAVGDLHHALLLEPRHFGALAGLGLVYLALNQPQPALRALDAALVLNPHLGKLRQQADSIRARLSGTAL